jgi:hypothetical protein
VKPNRDYNNRVFGYTLSEFLGSIHNPYRIQAQRMKSFESTDCVEDNHYCCGLVQSNHNHPSHNGLWDSVYISHDNKLYLFFNMLVTIICLVSSYYYASLVGFRYSAGGEIDVNFKVPTMIMEGIFLLHMITQFFLEFRVQGEKLPVSDPFKIWMNYLYNDYKLDLLCLLPL